MNILITGCAGFIGSWVCQKLLNKHIHKIIGIDNFDPYYPKSIKLENMLNFKNNPDFTFVETDITDIKALNEIFENKNIDIVIHLAAKAGVRNSVVYPVEYTDVNVNGTVNILNCMKKYGVKKIIFSSSSSVYGERQEEKYTEDMTDLKPISVYAQTKKSAEDFIELYSRKYGINAVCLRFFTVYGQRQRPDLAICKFTSQIKKGETLTVYGDGSTYRDYTHIEDISDGIISAITYDKTNFEIINLGSDSPVKLSDMIKTLEDTIGKKAKIKNEPIPAEDMKKTCADISKAKKLLDYSPKISFKDGVSDFVQHYNC